MNELNVYMIDLQHFVFSFFLKTFEVNVQHFVHVLLYVIS